jgi:hypothetical protein
MVAQRGTIVYILCMGISAVSSVGNDYLQLFRVFGSGPRGIAAAGLARVQGIPALAGREDAAGKTGAAETALSADAKAPDPSTAAIGAATVRRVPAPDPRRPESIIAERAADSRQAAEATKRHEASSRLDDLLGQKSAIERRQAEEKGARSADVLAVLSQLKARDGEVRAHEAAHIATGGRYITGGASYTYERGPDGAQYAVGGEVGIDASPASGKPEETVQKMRIVRAAALAPSEPSGADIAVAAAASQTEAAAIAEIAQRNAEEAAKSYSKEVGLGPSGSRGAEGDRTREPRGAGLDLEA